MLFLSIAGENSFLDWAKIVDCGDAPLTFLDNTVALKQLEKAHKVVLPANLKQHSKERPQRRWKGSKLRRIR